MSGTGRLRQGVAVALTALTLTAGCGGQASPATPAKPVSPPAASLPTHPAGSDRGGGSGGGGSGSGGNGNGSATGGRAAPPTVPADWPADVPIPPGQLQGTTAGAGRWSALLIVDRSAADTMTASARIYTDAGFTPVSDSLFRKGKHLVTIGVENRDHSTTRTTLVVGVSPLP